MRISIYTNRELTIEATNFINNNRASSYLGSKGSNNYFNVNGIVWEIWQDGCGNYPTSENIKVADFKLN
jgi:hypothetical protein